MSKYNIYKEENEIHVFGYDQQFSKEDIKSLWEEYNILYQNGGIVAVWVEERKNRNLMVHLMSQDDGHIFWNKDKDICFNYHWLDNYIKTLIEVKNKLSK